MADGPFDHPSIQARIAADVLRIRSRSLESSAESAEGDFDTTIVATLVETLNAHARAFLDQVDCDGLISEYTNELRRVGAALIQNAEEHSFLADPYSDDRLRKIAESSIEYIQRQRSLTSEQEEAEISAAVERTRSAVMKKALAWSDWRNQILSRIVSRFEARYCYWTAEAIERVTHSQHATVEPVITERGTGGAAVFISYSWDSENHKGWVRALATRLRADGIDAILDQMHLLLGARSPEFMERSVRESSCVLVICTEKYKQRFDNREGGAGYEGHIITGEIVSEVGKNKFIPVLRSGDWKCAMPTALSGTHGVDLRNDSPEEYRRLVKRLHGITDIPPVGPQPEWLKTSLPKPEGRADRSISLESPSEVMRLPVEDRPLILDKRGSSLVVRLKNETLDPMEHCAITLDSLQQYSERRRAFQRNPFTPIVLIPPATVNAGHTTSEAAALARCSDVQDRFLTVSNSPIEFQAAGIWLADIIVEGDGKKRKETLFFKWTPGEEPQFIEDPRLSGQHDKPAVVSPVTAPDPNEYLEQRRQLKNTDVVEKIWSQPHWRIWIRPTEFRKARFQNLDQCRQFMNSSYVRIQTWVPYPWFSKDSIETDNEWIAGENDKSDRGVGRAERWVLFRSGQFVHNRAFNQIPELGDRVHALEILDIVSAVFEFAAQMAHRGVLSPAAKITFELRQVDGRRLTWPQDVFLDNDAVKQNCWCQNEMVSVNRFVDIDELQAGRRELALEVAVEIYSSFGWSDPPRDRLASEQERRFGTVQQQQNRS